MLDLYIGPPKEGKTYSVVKYVIIPACEQGRPVITNIALKPSEKEGIDWVLQEDYPDAQIIHFDKNEPMRGEHFDFEFFEDEERFPVGAIYALDEVWRYFPTSMYGSKMTVKQKSFFTEHGHRVGENGFTNELVFIAQDSTFLSSFVTAQIQHTYVTHKMSMFGKSGENWAHFDTYKGVFKLGQRTKPLTNGKFQYKEEVYKYYISQSESKAGTHVKERSLDTRTNVLTKALKKLVLGFVLLIVGVGSLIYYFTGGIEPHGQQQAAGDTETPDGQIRLAGQSARVVGSDSKEKEAPISLPDLSFLYIAGTFKSDGYSDLLFMDSSGNLFQRSVLERAGYTVTVRNKCFAELTDKDDQTMSVYCGFGVRSDG